MDKYMVIIYGWNTTSGKNCKTNQYTLDTPQKAQQCINDYTEPYSHATIQRTVNGVGFVMCDWDGIVINDGGVWPIKKGVRYGQLHPDAQAFQDDRDNIINEIVKASRAGAAGGTMAIAQYIMSERHPSIFGFAEELGWAAADVLCAQR